MNGTVWSIRPFKFVLTSFYQFIELNIFNSPCPFLLHCLCADCSLGLECAFFYGANFLLVFPPLSLLVFVCTYPLAPVTLYVTACISLPLDCEFRAGHIFC